MRQQSTHHLLRVDAVRLALLCHSVHQKARGIENNRFNSHGLVQPARQPEALVASLVAAHGAHLPVGAALCLGPVMLDQSLEALDIRRAYRVQPDPLAQGTLQANNPPLPADLDRDVQRAMFRSGRR